MSQVAILADTHIPGRASTLPEWVQTELRAADHVIHAGDFDAQHTYDEIADLASTLTAVTGNMDPAFGLPTVTSVTIDGVDFVVTHGTGALDTYRSRVGARIRERNPDAVGIAGHTHKVLDTTVDGTRLLNPGSATGAAPADRATMYRATVADGQCTVTLLEDGTPVDC